MRRRFATIFEVCLVYPTKTDNFLDSIPQLQGDGSLQLGKSRNRETRVWFSDDMRDEILVSVDLLIVSVPVARLLEKQIHHLEFHTEYETVKKSSHKSKYSIHRTLISEKRCKFTANLPRGIIDHLVRTWNCSKNYCEGKLPRFNKASRSHWYLCTDFYPTNSKIGSRSLWGTGNTSDTFALFKSYLYDKAREQWWILRFVNHFQCHRNTHYRQITPGLSMIHLRENLRRWQKALVKGKVIMKAHSIQ